MEGKKHWVLCQDCLGVSEVYGQLLMMSIVVIAFSTIAVTVFSDGGAVKPEHTPNTDLHENISTSTNKIQIVHSGGEAIDRSAIKIRLSIKIPGESQLRYPEFSGSNLHFINPDGKDSDPDDNVFALGDCIIIDTTDADNQNETDPLDNGLEIKSNYDIDMFFVDTPSQQVIQKVVLQKGSRESNFPYWITPHPYGSASDNSTNSTSLDWLPTELVDGINDNLMTDCHIYNDRTSSENFTFGIDEYGLDLINPLTKVELKIVYEIHDNSQLTLALEINDKNPDEWITVVPSDDYPINLESYQTIVETDKKCVFPITKWVNTTEELSNLTVRFSGYGHAGSTNKIVSVDFIGVHAE